MYYFSITELVAPNEAKENEVWQVAIVINNCKNPLSFFISILMKSYREIATNIHAISYENTIQDLA